MRGGEAFRASARRGAGLPPTWSEGRARASTDAFPFRNHRTQAEVAADAAAQVAIAAVMQRHRAEQDQQEQEIPDADNATADDRSGCEGSTPEGTSGAVPGGEGHSANVDQCRNFSRIALPRAPRRTVKSEPVVAVSVPPSPALPVRMPLAEPVAPAPVVCATKVWCGPCAARVPDWFGDGCISGDCPLKGPR